jgi:hypothetical protein
LGSSSRTADLFKESALVSWNPILAFLNIKTQLKEQFTLEDKGQKLEAQQRESLILFDILLLCS